MADMYTEMANGHEKLRRGKVWCLKCGREQDVRSSNCLRNGWPECCGHTMTIDSPGERKELERSYG